MLKMLGDVVLNIAFWGFIAGYMISPHPAHPRAPVRRIGAAGFFWALAGWRSMRQRSLRPLVRHAEWRMAWRAARGF